MRKAKFLALILLLALGFVVWLPPTISQEEPAIQNGFTWLRNNQNADGSWGDGATNLTTRFHTTTVVVDTFHSLNITDSTYQKGIQWVSNQNVTNIDYISQKAEALTKAGMNASALIDYLTSAQNPDGGWGIADGYSSDNLDTAQAMRAIAVARYLEGNVLNKGITYLLTAQSLPGGYGLLPREVGKVYCTSLVLLALKEYKFLTRTCATTETIISASFWLSYQQHADGGWGGDNSTVFESSLASLALRKVGYSFNSAAAASYIQATQNPDGSWNSNAYETALALRALQAIILNRAPVLSPIGDQTLNEGTSLKVAISALDPDTDLVTLSVSFLPPFATFIDNGNGTGTVTLTPSFMDAGVYSDIEITATDGNFTSSETFTITVNNVNRAPIVDAGLDQTVYEGTSVNLFGSGYDPDGDTMTPSWTQTAGPTTVLSNPNSLTPFFTAPDVETDRVLTFNLRVSDGVATSADTMNVRVRNITPGARSRTYTLDADFDEGIYVGVEHEIVHDQLQLSKEATTLPIIWIPNLDGTVSKIDTVTGKELGRYRVAPPDLPSGGNPSRTTVDLQGNVWVGLRQAGTVVKIGLYEAGQWIDRNEDGVAQTSRDLNNDGNITDAEILPWGQDESVLYEVVLVLGYEGTYVPGTYNGPYDTDYWGTAPRGLAIDANNNLWAGTWYTSKYYYINGSTGAILETVDVSPWAHNAYGAVIDRNGVLWSASLYGNHILRFDPSTDPPTINKVDLPHNAYGIGLDYADHLFVSGHADPQLSRINITTGTIDWTKYLCETSDSRGVVATSDNNIWIANSGVNTVTRYDNDGNLLTTISGFHTPTGVAVDAVGKVWVTDLGSEYIHRIDPATNSIDLSKAIIDSGGHYTYSDMTGMVSRTITTKIGTWTVAFDSGLANAPWGKISWTSTEPAGTSLTVKVRSSNDRVGWSTWETAINGVQLTTTPNGRYLQIETTMQTITGADTPILYDLTVKTSVLDVTKPVANAGPDQTVNEDTLVTFDGSASTDENGIAAYTWTFTDVTPKTLSGKNPIYTFATPGTYTVTLNVTDPSGNWATDTVTITVLDITKPTANAGPDQTVNVGEPVTFDAGGSTDNVGIVSYEWDFGDGTTGTGKTTTHTYASPGTYTVTLTVKDAAGNTHTDTTTITVREPFPLQYVAFAAILIGLVFTLLLLARRRKKKCAYDGRVIDGKPYVETIGRKKYTFHGEACADAFKKEKR